ncbi:unnamed protein product [marine sediment metagenome]|uniref:Acylneuraminate cytidylyltransferase n=1 Tax=marine sediment metagenome TaxID=412755 RepID=X0S0I0_9ZZZZ
MLRERNFVCIIPAKGNSTGLNGKNMRIVAGKPLVYWAIKHAKDSGIHDRIIVSSDFPDIGEYAESLGVEWQRRPDAFCTPNVGVPDIMPFVLSRLDKKYDYVQVLEPTAPLVDGIDISKAAIKLVANKADMIISICPATAPLGYAAPLPHINKEGHVRLTDWFPKSLRHKNRQQCKTFYQLDGNIYIAKSSIWKNKEDYWKKDIMPFIMPINKYVDIDDETDLMVADMRLRELYPSGIKGCIQNVINRFSPKPNFRERDFCA